MKQRGFTLIELIIVIVILGILAVTAAPRFIDVQSEANIATLRGVLGSLESGNQLIFAKAVLENKQGDATNTIEVSGNTVEIVYGYAAVRIPSGSDVNSLRDNFAAFLELDLEEGSEDPDVAPFNITPLGSNNTAFTISLRDKSHSTSAGLSCAIIYNQAVNAQSAPVISIELMGC